LDDALRLDLDWVREHTRLGELAARWEARGRPDAALLRGDEIADAKTWQAARKDGAPDITESQRAYVEASIKAEDARRRVDRARLAEIAAAQARAARFQRRGRWSLAAIAFVIVIGMGVGSWLLHLRQKVIDHTQANLLGELARVERLRGNLDGALKLAVHG